MEFLIIFCVETKRNVSVIKRKGLWEKTTGPICFYFEMHDHWASHRNSVLSEIMRVTSSSVISGKLG